MVNFIVAVVTTPIVYIPLFIVLMALICWGFYSYGHSRGSTAQYDKLEQELASKSVATEIGTWVEPEVLSEVEQVEAITAAMQVVGYLEPSTITAAIPLSKPAQMAEEIASTGIINIVPVEETINRLQLDRDVLIEKVNIMTEKLARSERLRKRHWASLKAERARSRHLLGTYDLARRPSKPKLLAEVIDISTRFEHRTVRLVPPTIASIWHEDLAVA